MHPIPCSDRIQRGYRTCSVNISITPSPFQNRVVPRDLSPPPPFPGFAPRFLYKQPSQTHFDGVSAPHPGNTLRQILFSRHITATTPFSSPLPRKKWSIPVRVPPEMNGFSHFLPARLPLIHPITDHLCRPPFRGLVHNLQESRSDSKRTGTREICSNLPSTAFSFPLADGPHLSCPTFLILR